MDGSSKHTPRGPHPRERLEELIAEGLSVRRIAARLDRSPTTVRYWLSKYGLTPHAAAGRRRRHGRAGESSPVIQSECKRHGLTEFALQATGYYKCRRCNVEAVQRWRRRIKLRLIEEAGGACVLCGFDAVPAALQFHHLDPAVKEFGLSARGITRSLESLRGEAAKCVLLCSNCHAGVESGAVELPTALVAAKLRRAA